MYVYVFPLRFNNQRSKAAGNGYINDAYYFGSGKQATEMKCDDRIYENVPDIKPKGH